MGSNPIRATKLCRRSRCWYLSTLFQGVVREFDSRRRHQNIMAAKPGFKQHCDLCDRDIGTYAFKRHRRACARPKIPTAPRSGRYSPGGWNKGLTKFTDPRLSRTGDTYRSRYAQGLYKVVDRSHPPERRKRISESVFKAHREGRMGQWTRKEPSYAEKFMRSLIQNEFSNKDVCEEYRIGRYRVDFAWLSTRKIIEIDGRQHDLPNAVEYDRIRDAFIQSEGWTILRIKWMEMFRNTQYWKSLAKKFVDG